MMMRLTLAVGLVVAAVFAQIAPSSAEPIICSSPIAADDSAESLKLRHGAEAAIEEGLSTGVEDVTYRGLVLHPGSREWRIRSRSRMRRWRISSDNAKLLKWRPMVEQIGVNFPTR